MKPSIQEFTKIDGNTTSYSINGIKGNARLRVEQDADLVLENLEIKILGQPHDDVLLTTDRRFKLYKANEDRIILKDRLVFRKYKYHQILIPRQLVLTLESPRRIWKTSWNHQNNNCIQRNVLLPENGPTPLFICIPDIKSGLQNNR